MTVAVDAKCCNDRCNRVRGKKAKPWQNCIKCNGTLCLFCAPTNRQNPKCNKCSQEEWEAEWEAEKITPVECKECHNKKLRDEFTNSCVPTVCKLCDEKKREAKAQERERQEVEAEKSWVPGTMRRVVVDGYTYESDLPVKRGTKVLIPASWLDELHGRYGPQPGTVTSFVSDYSGDCKRILRVVDGMEQVQDDSPQTKALKEIKVIVDDLVTKDKLPDNWYMPIFGLLSKAMGN